MRRKLPSTTALAFFEAAARHQSYTKAAEELTVTQSAVCRQIASLESFLGLPLFRRNRRGVELTEAGHRYSRQVASRLDEVERDARALMVRGGAGGSLELGVVPTFATRWLLPRLGDFRARHPGIEVHLTARTRPFFFEGTNFDAAIHAGEAIWPGNDGCFLMDERLIAVGSPTLVGNIGPGAGPGRPPSAERAAGRRTHRSAPPTAAHALPPLAAVDWTLLPLLQQGTRPHAWRQWFAGGGLQIEGDMAGPRLELFSMLTEAAIQGLGVALIPRFLIEAELARGQLVQVTAHENPSDRRYHLIHPKDRVNNPALGLFQRWLLEQLATAHPRADGQVRGLPELASSGRTGDHGPSTHQAPGRQA